MSTDPGSVSPVVLSLKGISKRFGAVQALDDVSMECRRGEIHAVVGENGSGKSTLLGIASGVLAPDAGEIEIDGRRFDTASAGDAQAYGLGMAYQTFSGVLELSVAENIFMSTPRASRPSYGAMERWAASVVEPHDLQVDVSAPMGSLPLAKRQMLEVVKALQSDPKVLVMDEPTTSLGPAGGRAAARARARPGGTRRRRHLRQPPPARGAERRAPRDGAARRRRAGHLRRRRTCPRSASWR